MHYHDISDRFDKGRRRTNLVRRLTQVFLLLATPTFLITQCQDMDRSNADPTDIVKEQMRENADSILTVPAIAQKEKYQVPENARNRALQVEIVDAASAVDRDEQHYLLLLAAIESTLDVTAAPAKGTARGIYQFVKQTWLEAIREHGAKYGLADEANAIKKGKRINGKYNPHFLYVTDKAMETRILDMRLNATIATQMAIEFTNKNKDFLINTLGQAATAENLYAVHFLGKRHAATFFRILDKNPHWNPVDYFKNPSKRNKGIFYFSDGKTPRSFGQIHDYFKSKIERAESILNPPVATPAPTAKPNNS